MALGAALGTASPPFFWFLIQSLGVISLKAIQSFAHCKGESYKSSLKHKKQVKNIWPGMGEITN